jgi:hypothetical protein
MPRLRKTLVAALGVGALALAPIQPAAAFGPFLPWFLARHAVGAAVALATLPLAVASSQGPVAAPYPPPPAYGGAPGYYAPPNYYGGSAAYYARPSGYYAGPQGYYRSPVSYPRSVSRYYESPRAYSASRSRYTGAYGAHVPNQSGRIAYRRR